MHLYFQELGRYRQTNPEIFDNKKVKQFFAFDAQKAKVIPRVLQDAILLKAMEDGEESYLIDLVLSIFVFSRANALSQVRKDPSTVHHKNKQQQIPLHLAVINRQLNFCTFLITNGSEINHRDENGYVNILSLSLYNTPSEHNIYSIFRCTPLHLAAQSGDHQVLLLFLYIQETEKRCENKAGNTALHLFAQNFESAKLDLLVLSLILEKMLEKLPPHEVKAFINKANKKGETALHFASYRGSIHIMEMLLAHGADYNALTETDESPLCYAIKNGGKGNRDAIMLLLTEGANIYMGPTNGLPVSLKFVNKFLKKIERGDNASDSSDSAERFLNEAGSFEGEGRNVMRTWAEKRRGMKQKQREEKRKRKEAKKQLKANKKAMKDSVKSTTHELKTARQEAKRKRREEQKKKKKEDFEHHENENEEAHEKPTLKEPHHKHPHTHPHAHPHAQGHAADEFSASLRYSIMDQFPSLKVNALLQVSTRFNDEDMQKVRLISLSHLSLSPVSLSLYLSPLFSPILNNLTFYEQIVADIESLALDIENLDESFISSTDSDELK